jgi:hypothetical protein
MKTNAGNDGQAAAMGGDLAGVTGSTTSAPTATTVTDSGASFGTLTGHMVVMTSGTVAYGVITSNTGTVLTIDRWYAPASPNGAAVGPPTTGTYVVLPGQAPYWYMAITTDSTSPAATDTSLASEIVAAGSGCLRKQATFAHTTGVASYSLATTYTYTATDQTFGSRAIAKMGVFNTLSGATGRMQFETLVSPTATLTATGDQLTITDTISN